MDAREFHTLAQQLGLAATEAAWRSAVSRAYYAVFHVARQLMEDLGFTVPRADRAHAYLWLRLANSGDPQIQQAGNALNDLRRHRNQADYDIKAMFTQGFAQARVHAADLVIHAFDAAAIDPTRTTITDAMKIYERDVLKDITWHP